MTYRPRLTRLAATAALAVAATGALAQPAAASNNPQSYFVSCTGNDENPGKSAKKPWKSVDRANDAELRPGDRLLFERGCTWDGERLNVTWSGTADRNITIANYGSGSKPLIRNGKNSNVKITGSHLTVRGLRVDYTDLPTVACNQPIDDVYGFNLTGGASNVTIAHSEASGSTAGIHLSKRSYGNTIRKNKVFDNDVLTSFGADPSLDLGAWGILVRSDDNEIVDNHLWNNEARCSNRGHKIHSNSVELYEGDRNHIARNRSTDRVFSELGSSSGDIAEGNEFEFNVHDSDHPDARFITTRGAGAAFGPVRTTSVTNNTIVLTGKGSKGVVCGGSCGAGVLSLHDNIIVAQEKTIYASANADIGTNVVWGNGGKPFVQIGEHGHEDPDVIHADPRFVNAEVGNFRLRDNSPAIGTASDMTTSNWDVSRKHLVHADDLGAFDY